MEGNQTVGPTIHNIFTTEKFANSPDYEELSFSSILTPPWRPKQVEHTTCITWTFFKKLSTISLYPKDTMSFSGTVGTGNQALEYRKEAGLHS